MALNVQIHGGPRDGEYVANMGPRLRMPIPRHVNAFIPADAIPACEPILVDEYELRRGYDGEMFYVRMPR